MVNMFMSVKSPLNDAELLVMKQTLSDHGTETKQNLDLKTLHVLKCYVKL